jgi:dolichyl-phosphate beta-glucosyltransferase
LSKYSKKVDLTLVVPSYNEQERLPVMLDDTVKHLKKSNKTYEIIIANDGSKDKTTEVALAKAKELSAPLVVLEYPKNRGKGGAVRAGMSIAQGERILMVDADGATTFSDLDKVWGQL